MRLGVTAARAPDVGRYGRARIQGLRALLSRNSPVAVSRSTTDQSGTSSTPRSSASKKGVVASERDRPDVARRRTRWKERQVRIAPERLVFIDETWTRTDMEPLRGWATCGRRLTAKVPYGHWKTMTFIAALRHDRIEAPWMLDGPINAAAFQTYVEKALLPTLKPGDLVIMDKLSSHRSAAVRKAIRSARAKLIPAAEIFSRSQPDRTGLRQAQASLTQGGCANRRNPRSRCRPTPRHLHPARMRKLLLKRRIPTNRNFIPL